MDFFFTFLIAGFILIYMTFRNLSVHYLTKLAKDIVHETLQEKQVIQDASDLAVEVLDSPETLNQVLKTLSDPKVIVEVTKQINFLLEDPEIIMRFNAIVNEFINSKETHDNLLELLLALGDDVGFQKKISKLLTECLSEVLGDDKLYFKARAFMIDVLSDKEVQSYSGQYLKSAVSSIFWKKTENVESEMTTIK